MTGLGFFQQISCEHLCVGHTHEDVGLMTLLQQNVVFLDPVCFSECVRGNLSLCFSLPGLRCVFWTVDTIHPERNR